MTFAVLIVQGALMGYVAGQAFTGAAFWGICIINAILVVMYGIAKDAER